MAVEVVGVALSQEERARRHDEVRLLAEIRDAVARGQVERVIELANVLGWVHYGPR